MNNTILKALCGLETNFHRCHWIFTIYIQILQCSKSLQFVKVLLLLQVPVRNSTSISTCLSVCFAKQPQPLEDRPLATNAISHLRINDSELALDGAMVPVPAT